MSQKSEISQAAAAMGRVKSAKKAKASRANGAKGGRPKFHWHPAPARGFINPAAQFYRYTVRRLSDGAERFTDSRPRVRSDKYIAWDNRENREV